MEPEGGWSEYELTSSPANQHHHQAELGVASSLTASRPQTHADILKPLVRRRLKHQRDLAHSLVGTPNYIAPEVLARTGQC